VAIPPSTRIILGIGLMLIGGTILYLIPRVPTELRNSTYNYSIESVVHSGGGADEDTREITYHIDAVISAPPKVPRNRTFRTDLKLSLSNVTYKTNSHGTEESMSKGEVRSEDGRPLTLDDIREKWDFWKQTQVELAAAGMEISPAVPFGISKDGTASWSVCPKEIGSYDVFVKLIEPEQVILDDPIEMRTVIKVVKPPLDLYTIGGWCVTFLGSLVMLSGIIAFIRHHNKGQLDSNAVPDARFE